MNSRAEIGTAIILVLILVVGGTGAGVYAYNEGYMPIKEILPERAPPEIEADKIAKPEEPKAVEDSCTLWFKEFYSAFPGIEKMKWKLYRAKNLPVFDDFPTQPEIFDDIDIEIGQELILEKYREQLIAERFVEKVEHWSVLWNGYPIKCALFMKGWTFVFIITVRSNIKEITTVQGTPCVLYMTGHRDVYWETFADSDFLPSGADDPEPPVDPVEPPSDIIEGTGTIIYLEIEGGFYGIQSDDGEKYLPIPTKIPDFIAASGYRGIPEEYRVNGLKVKFAVRVLKDQTSIFMWGKLVELLGISRIQS